MYDTQGDSKVIENVTQKNSYANILRSSSIMGGAAGINILLGMVRVKFASVLIGTTGIGLMASLTSIQGLVGTLFGLGIGSSAVREVAGAVGRQDDKAIGTAVRVLRRISWLTGLAGMAAMMLFSPLLSQLTFGSNAYIYDIAALGLVILFGNIAGGQMALIQGMRRIGDIARVNIIGAIFATVAAIGFYTWLGLRGIVPALVSIAAMQLAISWYFARRGPVPPVVLGWRQTFSEAGGMVRLGLVFMWTGLLSAGVSYLTVWLITEQIGLQAVGLYSAAFNLSGIFVNFVLNAMGADYYPRLTGVAHDKKAMTRMVNEQTEIGLLLAVPGLLATMALAPWIIQIFYTKEFLPAAELLQWFILGCLGRVISWPLGFVMIALGKGRMYLLIESSFYIIHMVLIALGLHLFGIVGVAIAFVLMYAGYILAVYAVSRVLIGFRWSSGASVIALLTLPGFIATLIAAIKLPLWPATIIGLMLTLFVSMFCLRGLVSRIGIGHSAYRFLLKVPGFKMFCGL